MILNMVTYYNIYNVHKDCTVFEIFNKSLKIISKKIFPSASRFEVLHHFRITTDFILVEKIRDKYVWQDSITINIK